MYNLLMSWLHSNLTTYLYLLLLGDYLKRIPAKNKTDAIVVLTIFHDVKKLLTTIA
jgi:hypothetical protein